MSQSLKQLGRLAALLVLSALLEVGGDAAMRKGLEGQKAGFALGATLLILYGLVVNLSRLDFSRLMGVYIAVFFVVSQALAAVVFKEKLSLPVCIGGSLIILGGCIIHFWRVS